MSPAAARAKPHGTVAAGTQIDFDLTLTLRAAAAARAFVRSVSSPQSPTYRHYLTDQQWVQRFAPSTAQVRTAQAWLRKQGFSVGSVPGTRMYVPASGTAGQVERAFSTGLGLYQVDGRTVRLSTKALSVPTSIAGAVSGVVGVNEVINTTAITRATPAQAQPAPPPGFRNPQPCSAYYGQAIDNADSPSLYAPWAAPRSYDICGYQPAQLRSAYDVQRKVAAGTDGRGVAVAIVDAYDSPHLFADAQKYAALNDPAHPLLASQFFDVRPRVVRNERVCAPGHWYDEQALDVEATHAMAPGADILYVGAKDCTDPSLLAALQTAVTSGASVVSSSWGDTVGDLFDDADAKAAFDNTFLLADATGVSILFASGDEGDNFSGSGLDVPDYPASSPLVTAVGGTSLQIGSAGQRKAELGWSTGSQTLCAGVATPDCGAATAPTSALGWQSGGGGGTSYTYAQPFYQAGIVPKSLSERNSALFGPQPLRVIPDISMDADVSTGMLIGLTQRFPSGVRYGQFKVGGTSLAGPLLAGVIADTDQAARVSAGFINPTLYEAYADDPGAIRDILPPADPFTQGVIRVEYANSMNAIKGYDVTLRTMDYEGPERFCDGAGNCATRDVTLTTAKGFDSMTGLGVVGRAFITDLAKF